jgi:hypothetical protein
MSRGKEVNLKVKWNTHKVFVGDICYALDDDLYQRVWGDKLDFKDGEIESYAVVAGTEYGDGCYEGDEASYCVDAGVIGVTDIEHYMDPGHSIDDLPRLGVIVEIPSGQCEVCFDADTDGTFYITINDLGSGETVFHDVICTGDDDDDDWDDEDEDDDFDPWADDDEDED